MSRAPLVYLVAAERSGDLLGAGLAQSLKTLTDGDIRLAGIGGAGMAAEGISSDMDTAGLSILGWFEGLKAYGRIRKLVDQAVTAILARKPDVVVLIDSWGFTLRVAQGVRAADPSIRLVKYVGPQVFATRPGRAQTMAEVFDQLLTILELDVPFYDGLDIDVEFVGNPSLERLPSGDGAALRQRHGISAEVPVMVLLFGSRPSEIERLFDDFRGAAALLKARYPDLAIVVPLAESVSDLVTERLRDDPGLGDLVVVSEQEKADAFAAADVALACSGTVVLELATAGVPTVTAYRLGGLSYFLLSGLKLYKPKYISLVNMAADAELVPEFLQQDCSPDSLSAAVAAFLDDPEARAAVTDALRQTTAGMRGEGRASERAARAVLAGLAQG
ncbi:lipid-A-disaccharide synthase [Maricaulis sp. CAU 1757]